MNSAVDWQQLLSFAGVIGYIILFSAIVGADAGQLLARNLLGSSWKRPAEIAASVVGDLCLVGWILFLSAKGEHVETVVAARPSEESERRLRTRLMAFEQSLSRVASRSSR